MKRLLQIIFFLIAGSVNAQNNCELRLIDSYSLDVIELDNSIEIKNAKFSVDTVRDLIILQKLRGKNLDLSFNDFSVYNEKFKLRKHKNQTITRQLTPNDSTIQARFENIWNTKRTNSDTLNFVNKQDLSTHISTYLKYLKCVETNCDNGLCAHSNTYTYKINFLEFIKVYNVNSISNTNKSENSCAEIEQYLAKFIRIFPYFTLIEKSNDELVVEFVITM